MAHSLGQCAFTPHALCLAHLVRPCLYLPEHGLYPGLGNPTSGVCLDHLAQLPEAEFHVVEVLDGLAQLYGYVSQHGLEVSESLACRPAAVRIHGLLGDGVGDEHHHAPVLAILFCV